MATDDQLRLRQMLETVQRIRRMVHRVPRPRFERDEIRQLAVLHLIQVLGEAASRVSADFRDAHPELPWAQMSGMRNRIVHGYDDVDPDIVWRVATKDLEPVLASLERLVTHSQQS